MREEPPDRSSAEALELDHLKQTEREPIIGFVSNQNTCAHMV